MAVLAVFASRRFFRLASPLSGTFARYVVKNLVHTIVKNLLYKINLNNFGTLLDFVKRELFSFGAPFLFPLFNLIVYIFHIRDVLHTFLARSSYKSLYVALYRCAL